jgi:hypothetical protein
MKKAMELSILCDCQVAVLVFSGLRVCGFVGADIVVFVRHMCVDEIQVELL